jgi:hypothetical protein
MNTIYTRKSMMQIPWNRSFPHGEYAGTEQGIRVVRLMFCKANSRRGS